MAEANLPSVELALRNHFVPSLRADGFSGSGRTFRRVSDGWVQVINVQGSRYGGQFAVNLGLQPLSIFHVLGEAPDPKKITESLCEFRRRLSDSGADQWWAYEPTQESMNEAAREACAVYETIGRDLFRHVGGAQSQINGATPDAFASGAFDFSGFGSTQVRMALVLARLRNAQGRTRDAASFAAIGLAATGAASALRRELAELAELQAGRAG